MLATLKLSPSFIKDMLMIPSCYFDQKIILKYFDVSWIANFEGFIPVSYKSNLIFILSFRAFKLCSNFELFHQEIFNLKDIILKNDCPCNFIDVCIKRFLNNIFIYRKVYTRAPKKKLICVLHFIGKTSLRLRSKLVKSVRNNLGFCNHSNFIHCFV